MRKNFLDYNLDFGKLTAAGTFPNEINMEKSTLPRVAIACQAAKGSTPTLFTLTAKKEDGSSVTRTASFCENYAEIFVDEELKNYPILSCEVTGTGTFWAFIDPYEG